MNSIIFNKDYSPHFSGHETFPLRQLWLKKAYDAVEANSKGAFTSDDAIVTFGVGKNMVSSIKHWAVACGMIETKNGYQALTPLSKKLFDINGLDPYCEQYGTSWLAHWNLAGLNQNGVRATTWYLAFNHINEQNFSPKQLLDAIKEYLDKKLPKTSVSLNTLERDVEVFLRTYATKPSATVEDVAEPMLTELGLIQVGLSGLYEYRRGPKSTLPDNVFLYALIDFWNIHSPSQKTLSFESIVYDPGSPGRVFKLDEDSVAERLINLEHITNGRYIWSDTAGQKSVLCLKQIRLIDALDIAQ